MTGLFHLGCNIFFINSSVDGDRLFPYLVNNTAGYIECRLSLRQCFHCLQIESQKWNLLEKTLESPLDCKEIQLVHLKGDQSWAFIGRTDVEMETPIFWLPDVKS